MALNSETLQALADTAEDLECEVAIHRSSRYDDVIVYIQIDGAELMNEDLDFDIETAKEAMELEANDAREANGYFYN